MATANLGLTADFTKERTIDQWIDLLMQIKMHYPYGTKLVINGTNVEPEITAVAPFMLTAPAITGTAQDTEELTVSDGTWTGTPTITYQWYLDDGEEATAIDGETTDTYTVATADVGSTIYCLVTATNHWGAETVQTASTATVIAAE
jgi:hypothetical protein